MWPSYGWCFSQIWFWWGYTSVHLRLSLPIDNCSLRHGEFGWFEPTHLSVLAAFFFYFCSFIFFLSLLSQDQTWKWGFQGGSILQQDFQGTRAVQNLFASGEWLWDESARQVNDLSGVPKLERLMLKVPRKRDKWQKWIRVLSSTSGFFRKKSLDSPRHPNDPWIQWLFLISHELLEISPHFNWVDLRLLPGKSYFQATRPGRPGENRQKWFSWLVWFVPTRVAKKNRPKSPKFMGDL